MIYFDHRLYHVILGSWAIERSCKVISAIFKTLHICATVFQWQSSNCMTQNLGSLQLLTFLLVFSLLILLIQWIQVLKWMYFSCFVYYKVLRASFNLQLFANLFAWFRLFHPIGELMFTSWRKSSNEPKPTNLFKGLLNLFQDKRRNGWKESKSKSWALLGWCPLLVHCSPLKTYLDPSLV